MFLVARACFWTLWIACAASATWYQNLSATLFGGYWLGVVAKVVVLVTSRQAFHVIRAVARLDPMQQIGEDDGAIARHQSVAAELRPPMALRAIEAHRPGWFVGDRRRGHIASLAGQRRWPRAAPQRVTSGRWVATGSWRPARSVDSLSLWRAILLERLRIARTGGAEPPQCRSRCGHSPKSQLYVDLNK
jgi:hypothetical protein